MNCFYLIVFIVLDLLDYSFAECETKIKYIDEYVHDRREELPKVSIRPKIQHGRHKRSIEHTLEENGLHVNDLILTYRHNDKDVIIDLWLNENLIPQGHFISHQTEDGGTVVRNLTKIEIDLCHYHGTIRGTNNSRVALSTCNGINGIIYDEDTTYHIQSGPELKIDSDHFLYKHVNTNLNTRCGNVEKASKNINGQQSKFNENGQSRFKRDASSADSPLQEPYNSNRDTIYLELMVVVDNSFYKKKNRDLKKVHAYVKDLVNIASSLYVPLNIFIALTGILVWSEKNEIEISSDGDLTLSRFVGYRKSNLIDKYPNDNAHLLLNSKFDCGVVGIAYEGQMCTTKYSGGITTGHSQFDNEVATTMAHEIGHNFGLTHDDPKYCKCITEGCIMHYSTTKVLPKHWSSCSLEQLSLSLHKGVHHCLKNKPTKLFGMNNCGNGFVELGEQCDCGLPNDCTNPCCNPITCNLHENATCATGKCCDLKTCQLHIAGHKCRKAKHECDLSEYCTGQSEYCPKDVFKRDTESCDQGEAYCYNGLCKSHLNQCKLLWGLSGKPAYPCFSNNKLGIDEGNCGFDRETQKFIKCNEEDIFCGLLQCRQLTDQLQYGKQSRITELTIKTNASSIICSTAIVNVGRDSMNPGLTPHGAKCGENKMCVDQKCVSLKILRAQGVGSACPEDCNGNGICNNQRHCHCSSGYAPPTCKYFGYGGSVDSGPLNNNEVMLRIPVMFIIIILIVLSFTTFGVIYWRKYKSLPEPSEIARKVSTAPREMIEIIRRVSVAPIGMARRVSIAPREIARRISNTFNSATTIQSARSRLRRTDGSQGLYNSRELILNVDTL